MRHLQVTLCCLVIFLTNGCKEEDEPAIQPTTLLTVFVDNDFSFTDGWIVFHDNAGNLLEYQQFEPGTEFSVSTNKKVKGNSFSVTIFKYILAGGGSKQFTLTSYTDIEPGKKLFLRSVNNNPPFNFLSAGEVNVSIPNTPVFPHSSILVPPTDGYACTSTYSSLDKILHITSRPVDQSKVDFLVQIVDDSGNPLYKIINDVTDAGGDFVFDYDDFSNFDQVIEFVFPPSSQYDLEVSGMKVDDPGHWGPFITNHHLGGDSHTSWKAGYLNNFSNHRTNLKINYSGYYLTYSHVGSIPTGEVAWPNVSDFAVENSVLKTFSAKSSSAMTYRASSWFYNLPEEKTRVNWNVYSQHSSQKFNKLPDEILGAFPGLKIDKFQYKNTSFFTGPRSYENFLNVAFGIEEEGMSIETGITLE